MEIQLIRNATVVVGWGERRILVDPCLSAKGRLPPLAILRGGARMNPMKDLPGNTEEALRGIEAGLVTHFRWGHVDHLDGAGVRFLRERGAQVFCGVRDERALKRKGLRAVGVAVEEWTEFMGGTIRAVPTAHGSGMIGKLMGPGVGYLVRMPGQPSLYIVGDTVLTERVRMVLEEWKPEVCVVNAGGAVLDVGGPILMPVDEIVEFVRLAPGKVVAVHLEAFNHCLTTREGLRGAVESAGLSAKVVIPGDGEMVSV